MGHREKRILRGFTMIELLIVIAILGILSTISFSSFINSIKKGRDSQRKQDISLLVKALEGYYIDFGSYPDDDTNGGIVGCQNSNGTALITCPAIDNAFKVYKNGVAISYINRFPTDPTTGQFYRYVKIDDNSYHIYAALENTQDKDVRIDGTGAIVANGWLDDCNTANCVCSDSGTNCNYKMTESGLAIQ